MLYQFPHAIWEDRIGDYGALDDVALVADTNTNMVQGNLGGLFADARFVMFQNDPGSLASVRVGTDQNAPSATKGILLAPGDAIVLPGVIFEGTLPFTVMRAIGNTATIHSMAAAQEI